MRLNIAVIFTGGTIGSVCESGVIDISDSAPSMLINDFLKTRSDASFSSFRPADTLSENMTAETLEAVQCSVRNTVSDGGFDGIIITPPVVYAVCFCFAALSMKTGGKSFRNAAWCGAVASVASVFLGLEPQFAPPERFVAYVAVAATVLAMTTLCLVFTAAGTAKIYAERFPRSRGKAKTCIAAAAIPYAAFAVAAVATFSTEYVWVASVLCGVKSAAE